MGYYTRRELPISYGLAEAFTLCDHWHCGMRGPTWPNRYFSHCASSGGLTANNGFCSEPTPYTALAEAGFSYRVYYTSLYFLLTITSVPQKNAYKMDKFFADCEAGTLANVNIVEPSFLQNDDHPPADVRNGQAFIATVYEAFRRSPQWNRCLMVVFYDEHGGFHDHVEPAGESGRHAGRRGLRALRFPHPGAGHRAAGQTRHVFHEVLDHSSVPGLVSRVFDLDHVNERSRLSGRLRRRARSVAGAGGESAAGPDALAPMQLPEDARSTTRSTPTCTSPSWRHWFRKMGMAHQASLPERRRLMRNYLLNAKKLGAVRFT
jgi:phospholipase C